MSNSAISKTEELLLCNFEDNYDVPNEVSYIKLLWSGDWISLTTKESIKNILLHYNNKQDIHDIFNNLKANEREETFCSGIASLLSFIQCNFTGPELPSILTDFLTEINIKDARQHLVIDGEEINARVQFPELFLIAKCIFENCALENTNIVTWWFIRMTVIHQYLLDECSETIFAEIKPKLTNLSDWELNPRLKAKLHLELSHFYLIYGEILESEKNLIKAKDLLRINFELAGELGKRTKYQERNVAQIVLKVHLTEGVDRPVIDSSEVPNITKLEDEVRLDKIEFCNVYEVPALPITEQTILLNEVQFMQRAKPRDELLLEESEAFLSALLQQNNNWSVRLNALLLRCLLESKHRRTIERSLMQCEILASHLHQNTPSAIDRLGAFWNTEIHPIWKIEAHIANLTLNLGFVKTALKLYLTLQMWEEVIICYTIMDLRHKAAEIIQTQLECSPTIKLWCLLGDATDDISCYEKAWELSQQKSSRAQRHWGQFLFTRKKYAESIPHLQKSLEINSLQNMVWLRLGFAALQVEDWKLAAAAYRRYTYLEPGGFEAWNNLAKAYIKLGEKTRAHYALQESLKFSFDNWKIWDNFMAVSAAIGYFSDVIRSYHQILDLKEKHLDTGILFLLTKQLTSNQEEAESDQNGRLLTRARELFGRLTSLYPNNSELWEMYAELSPNADLKAQRLFRAYRGLVQDDWAKNLEKCGKVLEICQQLGEVALEAGNVGTISSARLTLRSAITAAIKQSWKEHEEKVFHLEELLKKVMDLSK